MPVSAAKCFIVNNSTSLLSYSSYLYYLYQTLFSHVQISLPHLYLPLKLPYRDTLPRIISQNTNQYLPIKVFYWLFSSINHFVTRILYLSTSYNSSPFQYRHEQLWTVTTQPTPWPIHLRRMLNPTPRLHITSFLHH